MAIVIFGKKYKWAKPVVFSIISTLIISVIIYGKQLSYELLRNIVLAIIIITAIAWWYGRSVK